MSVYDTLTHEDRWNDHYDVILANPPFMSPKGGIRPHQRYSISSRRSEALFVDYILTHLNDRGRAGVIVPEGVIFQQQRGHTELRRLLVENCLVAVISLPGGVFQPYSGVKTSILIMDKALGRKTDHIAFFKVENDGYDLGAQRREIAANDLPAVQAEVGEYLRRLRTGEPIDDFAPEHGLIVPKERIAENGDYNLSGERYRTAVGEQSQYLMVTLGEPGLFEIVSGGTPNSQTEEYWGGNVPWITLVDLPSDKRITEIKSTERMITEVGLANSSAKIIPVDSIVVSSRATIGRIGINRIPLATNQGFKSIVVKDKARAIPEYLAHAITKLVPEMEAQASGATYKEITKTKFAELQIPLPPLEVQREIVAEIEGYQRVIDGARAVVDNWRPRIDVDPEWPVVDVGTACIVNPRKSEVMGMYDATLVSFVPMSDMGENTMYFETKDSKYLGDVRTSYTYFRDDDVLVAKVTPCFENGKAGIAQGLSNGIGFGSSEFYILRATESVIPRWIYLCVATPDFRAWATPKMTGTGGLQRVPRSVIESYKIPLPPLETQQAIVAELEAERALVEGNRALIERMEGKIQAAIGRVWGG